MEIKLFTSIRGIENLKYGNSAMAEPQKTEINFIEISVSPIEIEIVGVFMSVKRV